MEALDQARAPLTRVILARVVTTDETAGTKCRVPLTKPLHNGRVQTRTGVCMGSRWGRNGSTAVRSLPWPLGLAVGVCAFFNHRWWHAWPMPQKGGPIAQDFIQCISPAFTLTKCMVFETCGRARSLHLSVAATNATNCLTPYHLGTLGHLRLLLVQMGGERSLPTSGLCSKRKRLVRCRRQRRPDPDKATIP